MLLCLSQEGMMLHVAALTLTPRHMSRQHLMQLQRLHINARAINVGTTQSWCTPNSMLAHLLSLNGHRKLDASLNAGPTV
jgi:hypothetical protein